MIRQTVLRAILALAVMAGIALAAFYRDTLDPAALERWLAEAGLWGPVVFVVGYAAAAVLFLPGSVFTLAGGALFGPVWGTVFSLVGATIGATLAFLVARHLASDWVAAKAGPRLAQLLDGVEAEGWRFVAFVRLVPLFPFNLLNYALGLTRIRLSHYVVASFVCMAPGALAFSYLGFAGREALAGGEHMIRSVLIALALLAAALFLPRFAGRLLRAPTVSAAELRQWAREGTPFLLIDLGTGAVDADPARRLSIPLADLPARLAELGPTGQRLAVAGERRQARRAIKLLKARGYRDVHLVDGDGAERAGRTRPPG